MTIVKNIWAIIVLLSASASGWAESTSFEENALRNIYAENPYDKTAFRLVSRENEPFVFYGSDAERPDMLRCKENVAFKVFSYGKESGYINFLKCRSNDELPSNFESNLKDIVESNLKKFFELTQATVSSNFEGYREEIIVGKGKIVSFPIVMAAGHGVLFLFSLATFPENSDDVYLVQHEFSEYCMRANSQSKLCTSPQEAMKEVLFGLIKNSEAM